MKCDLCRHETISHMRLCETCADAIRRLFIAAKTEDKPEKPLAVRARAAS